jgi:transposase
VPPDLDLSKLTDAEKDDLILRLLPLIGQLEAAHARIAELEKRLTALEQPPKNPTNSSNPPSTGEKPNLPDRGKKFRRGHPGVTRALAEHPDRIIKATLAACPHCDHVLGAADMSDIHAYDHIDLPVIRPIVTRVNRHRGVCPCCHKAVAAPAPEGLEPGSPFGPGIAALVLHLHITQAVGFERLSRLMAEVFGLSISEGAIANMLARAQAPLVAAADAIAAAVRASPVVASDETSTRVRGKTCWQWVLLSTTAIYHVIADTRAAAVVTEFLQGRRPEIWIADRYGGQAGHGAARQMCLAHLARDAKFAIEAGDDVFTPGFRLVLLRAMAIGKRRATLKDSTLAQYRADLDRRLDKLLSGPEPKQDAGRRLYRAMRRDRADLFRFVTRRDVDYTNNACERALRPSVIFRKVTNGFRADWGAKVYAAAASVIATGRLHGLSALAALQAALAGRPILRPGMIPARRG